MHRFLAASMLCLALSSPAVAQPAAEQFKAGVDYFPIEPAQPTSRERVEVIEVFSYACHACASLQPTIDTWKKRLPAGASFVYMPLAWSTPWENVARAFYAAEALGVLEATHAKFFNAMFGDKKPLSTTDEIAQWYAATAGIKAADFIAATKSSGVNIKIARSKQLLPRFGVDGTPTMIIAGKYRVTGKSGGSWDGMLSVVDFLIARESAARGTAR